MSEEVRAITIKQPWASAIFYQGKDIENRSWATKYRGPLLIHSGLVYAKDAPKLFPANMTCPEPCDITMLYGCILGVVDLVDCVSEHKSRWWLGEYGFVLKNPRLFRKPYECRGKLGLWKPDRFMEIL